MTLFAAAAAHFLPLGAKAANGENLFFRFHLIFLFLSRLMLVQSHEITNLETFTQYLVSLQVFNPEGLGPSSTVLIMTDEGGEL
jgi:hypothetical protein